jgi:hypothetical protein
MLEASGGHHSLSETRENLHQRAAKVRLACIGPEAGSDQYGSGNTDDWLLVNSRSQLDLKAARERREVAGAEDISSIGGRGSRKDIDAGKFGEVSRKGEKVRVALATGRNG